MKKRGNSQSAGSENPAADGKNAPPQGNWVHRLFEPVDIAILVFFRIAFGLLCLRLVWLLVHHEQVHNGQTRVVDFVNRYFIVRGFNFKYYGFDWVQAWPGNMMYWHMGVLALCCVCITLGLFYRASMALFCLGFTYLFLLEQARYMNHYYLICLISMLMVFIPAHRAFSLDSHFWPKLRSQTAPAWTIWLLRFQLGIVYFYAGVAKLNMDWLSGNTIRLMMAKRGLTDDTTIMLMAYAGLLFDLCVVPLLLWRRTRPLAFIAMLIFNVTNSQTFHIDIFPWFMISGTLLFFSPSWPRKVVSLLFPNRTKKAQPQPAKVKSLTFGQHWTVALLASYAAIQLLLPLRHHLYPGDSNWTNDGHYFSWRMLLRVKQPTNYEFKYKCLRKGKPEIGAIGLLPPPADARRDWQFRKMLITPDMVLQFAHWQADRLRSEGCTDIDIRGTIFVSLTGRPAQWLVDPTVNLAKEPRRFITPYPWVVPLKDERPADLKSLLPTLYEPPSEETT